jgi:hypothetical protein
MWRCGHVIHQGSCRARRQLRTWGVGSRGLRGGSGWSRHRCRLRLSGSLRRGRNRLATVWLIGFRRRDVVNLFLESLQGLADSFPYLGKLSRTEDDKHDDQDNDQLGNSHCAEHSAVPLLCAEGAPRRSETHSIGLREPLSRKSPGSHSKQRKKLFLKR